MELKESIFKYKSDVDQLNLSYRINFNEDDKKFQFHLIAFKYARSPF